MGLIALILSVLLDAFRPSLGRTRRRGRVPSSGTHRADDRAGAATNALRDHPSTPWARRLLAVFAGPSPDGGSAPPSLSVPGWLGFVGLPVIAVALTEWLFGAVSGLLVLALHVGLLHLTVGLGPFYRTFSALRLLIGAGEYGSARALVQRWERGGEGWAGVADGDGGTVGSGSRGIAGEPVADDADTADDEAVEPAGQLVRQAIARTLLSGYRDVFAPLVWYLVLPGAVGAVLYLFARQAAISAGGVARPGYAWIDWVPLRLMAAAFALAGQFEETVFRLKAVGSLSASAVDPYEHQRLFLLPVAGGSLGLSVMDPLTESELRHRAPDLDLTGAEPGASSLDALSGLLTRSAWIGLGLYLLVVLLP